MLLRFDYRGPAGVGENIWCDPVQVSQSTLLLFVSGLLACSHIVTMVDYFSKVTIVADFKQVGATACDNKKMKKISKDTWEQVPGQ